MNIDLSSWVDFKTISGAFIGAGLVWISDYIKAKYNKSKQAHYLAVRLIPILEQFLDGCYDVAVDDGTCQGRPASGDGVYIPQAKEPTLELPNDVDWKSIKKDLVEVIMKLPVELYTINKNINVLEEFAEPDHSDLMFSRQINFAKYSLKVDKVISQLKTILGQKPIEYNEYWNPRKWCEDFIQNRGMSNYEGKK